SAPDSGEVLLEGKRISTLKPHEIAELGIARTFQNLQIFTNMTILENVMVSVKNVRKISSLGAMIRLPSIRYNEEKAKATAMEKLHMVGL
ncbi:ABC transporter ATP-binding protein, partial [Kocuria palustris]